MKREIGINRISPSMLVEYENCPLLFYYRSWLGIRLPQGMRHLKFGTAVHEAIGNIYDQCDKKTHWEFAELKLVKKTFLENWTESCVDAEDESDPVRRKQMYEDMKDDGLNIIKSYWNQKESLLAEYGILPDRLEIPMKIPIFHPASKEAAEIPMSGRIDGMQQNTIIEFKTSKARYNEFETRNSPQALSYNLLWYCKTGKIPDRTIYVVMLKNRKKEDRIQVLEYTYDLTDVENFFNKVEATLEKIRNREFDKPKIGHPRFCDCHRYEKLLSYKHSDEKLEKISKG
jgi:CRISPR/Cas system-associated exonuclease Cas4 (RecB family)